MKMAMLSFLFMVSVSAHAADTPTWNQEPTSFRSIVFGQPLNKQFPECVRSPSGDYTLSPQNTCWESDNTPNKFEHNAVIAKVFNLPDIGIGDNLIKGMGYTQVYLLDGKVEGLSINFASALFESFRALLISKYGQPTKTVQLIPDSNSQIWGRVDGWNGVNVSLSCIEFYISPDKSRCDVDTEKYLSIEKNDEKNKEQKQKDNL